MGSKIPPNLREHNILCSLKFLPLLMIVIAFIRKNLVPLQIKEVFGRKLIKNISNNN